MTFHFGSPDLLKVKDSEIDQLLHSVYVDEGYTSAETAKTLFAPDVVLQRGQMICSRSNESGKVAGMVIVVIPGSKASRIANSDETEMQLLAVSKEYRGYGLGRNLVNKSLEVATSKDFNKMVLWTQPSMTVAQKLYESVGFTRTVHRDFPIGDKQFYVYEKHW